VFALSFADRRCTRTRASTSHSFGLFCGKSSDEFCITVYIYIYIRPATPSSPRCCNGRDRHTKTRFIYNLRGSYFFFSPPPTSLLTRPSLFDRNIYIYIYYIPNACPLRTLRLCIPIYIYIPIFIYIIYRYYSNIKILYCGRDVLSVFVRVFVSYCVIQTILLVFLVRSANRTWCVEFTRIYIVTCEKRKFPLPFIFYTF